jgi:hypothetical protein
VLGKITPLIITHDEGPNIRRTFANLTWATPFSGASGSAGEAIDDLEWVASPDALSVARYLMAWMFITQVARHAWGPMADLL